MDFTLSSDELALRDGVRDFCEGRYGEDALRAQTPVDRALWNDLAGLGLFALRLPEDEGGAGLGAIEAAVAFIELGRALVPGPLVASHVAAGLVDGAAEGRTVVGWLDGNAGPVVLEHPELVDVVLVGDADDVRVVDASALDLETSPAPTDPLTPVALVRGTLPEGRALDAPALRRTGALLTAAYQVGIATAAVERSVAYAKEREQFGRAIGSFQAVKHLLADMYVRAELARAAVWAAAASLDDRGDADPDRAVAGAKVLADEAGLVNTKTMIQVHGGMGFTWEMPVHLYVKRAWLLSTTFGTADDHALAVAAGA